MFNGPKWTSDLKALLLEGKIDEAEKEASVELGNFPDGEVHRITQMRSLIKNVREFQAYPVPEGYRKITLKNANLPTSTLASLPDSILSLSEGFYSVGQRGKRQSSFEEDFHNLPNAEKERLHAARFTTPQDAGEYLEFRIVNGAFICGINAATHAYAFNRDNYISEESARLAKVHPVNFCHYKDHAEEFALLLPIPHHPRNYYHVVGEMITGLRLAKQTGDSPIVYQEDNLDLLKPICHRLGISTQRLIPFSKAKNVIFTRAAIPTPPPYYWNSSVFSFFERVAGPYNKPANKKIYLSRRHSSRSISNEVSIETALNEVGFDIVFAERLTVDEQIELFKNADIIVAAHGAGLANCAYMQNKSALLELFSFDMIKRDFYMRTRHNNTFYSCVIYNEQVDIGVLKQRLADLIDLRKSST